MPRQRRPKPATKFLVSLPEPLAIDLEAFCRLHFDAPRMEVIRRALTSYLEEQLSCDPASRKQFMAYKAQLTIEAPTTLRLVDDLDRSKG